jgi:threonine dehydratase
MDRRIRPYIRRTPVLECLGSEFGLEPFPLSLKLEGLQHSGSFKVRGAFANLLSRKIPRSGVVAASGGNHGAAVAYAARALGVPATIFVPRVSTPAKTQRIRDYGARLVIAGERYEDSRLAAERWNRRHGALAIHAFDDRETLLGQGTLGMELDGQLPDLDTVLVSVGGGGLVGGIAAWYRGKAKVVGVEPRSAPTLSRALAAGRPVDAPTEGGVARDSLAPLRVGELMFPIARKWVSEVLLVSDDQIVTAQQALWNVARVVAEPGGAAAFAAVLGRLYRPRRKERVAVIISGANTTAVRFKG